MTRSSIPYVVPESAPQSAAPSAPETSFAPDSKPLFVIDSLGSGAAPAAPEPSAESAPLTPDQQKAQALANLYLAYVNLFNACSTLVRRARPANKLKHNYFVCAKDLEDVVLNMDGKIAGALGAAQTPDEETKA